jgi:2-polyprenyl-3-methyl-5-hydroxy-6-metoxy-1,4-benzoquinol methylase|tara:strand:- start:908 stop:1774 length:867 start_codon:yes stop_codon:yes gene_type:complete
LDEIKETTNKISMDEKELKKKLNQYEFYHTIQLTENISTNGVDFVYDLTRLVLDSMKKINFDGKRVLDIGCRDGLFSFKAEELGASEIISIDNNISLGTVDFLIPFFKSNIKMYEKNLFDLTPELYGLFDIVLFPGTLYHLRYPFWALKILRNILKPEGLILLETAISYDHSNHSMLYCPVKNDSPYDPTSVSFFNEKGIIDTLNSMEFVIDLIDHLNLNNKFHKTNNLLTKIKNATKAFLFSDRLYEPRNIDRIIIHCRLSKKLKFQKLGQYWDSIHNNREGHTIIK